VRSLELLHAAGYLEREQTSRISPFQVKVVNQDLQTLVACYDRSRKPSRVRSNGFEAFSPLYRNVHCSHHTGILMYQPLIDILLLLAILQLIRYPLSRSSRREASDARRHQKSSLLYLALPFFTRSLSRFSSCTTRLGRAAPMPIMTKGAHFHLNGLTIITNTNQTISSA
jgi:hypothetical protein